MAIIRLVVIEQNDGHGACVCEIISASAVAVIRRLPPDPLSPHGKAAAVNPAWSRRTVCHKRSCIQLL